MEQWKYSQTPWNDIKDISKLTYLVYDYAKHWKINEISNLDEFIQNNKNNEELGEQDQIMLRTIRDQYPEGEVLNFFSNRADLQCVIGKNPHKKRYSIIFRGSESVWDWIYDMMIIKKTLFNNVQVHSGFYNQLTYNNTFQRIILYITDLINENPTWEWYIGGHSLGGALSTLAGFLLSRQFKKVRWTVVSLASPRVGNNDFKSSFENQANLRSYRLCNNKDTIPGFPMFYYCHVGISLHFDKSQKQWIEHGYIPSFSYYFYNLYNPWDHMCSAYMKATNLLPDI